VPDLGRRHQLEHGVDHAQARAQDGDEPDAVGELGAGRDLERRLDVDGQRPGVGQRLVAQEPADLTDQLAELLWLRGRGPQERRLCWTAGVG
jgi:hypothetical protein